MEPEGVGQPAASEDYVYEEQMHNKGEKTHEVRTLRTIHEHKKKTGEEMDHYEYQTDRLQAALEGLLDREGR